MSGRRRALGLAAASVAVLAGVYACGSDGPVTPQPRPGTLAVRFQTQSGDDRGVLLRINGPSIGTVVPAAGLEMIEGGGSAPRRLILSGALTTGVILRFEVPDVGAWAAYSVTVEQVTGGADYEQRPAASYQMSVVPPV